MTTLGVASKESEGLVIDLHEDAAARTIAQAARATAIILLQPKGDEQTAIRVRMKEARVDALIVSFEEGPAAALVPTGCLDATLFLDGQEYLFGTSLLEGTVIGGEACLVLARPVGLQTWQRRRFVRAELASSSKIRMTPLQPQGASAEVLTGDVLNISPDGLACRLAMHEADACNVGDGFEVAFTLSGQRDPFSMQAALRSKTPGGSGAYMILGIQFDTRANPSGEFDRLSCALKAYY